MFQLPRRLHGRDSRWFLGDGAHRRGVRRAEDTSLGALYTTHTHTHARAHTHTLARSLCLSVS